MPRSKNHQSWFFFWKKMEASKDCGGLGYFKTTKESAVFMKELLV
jgi:hypothetical protein